MCEIKLDSPSKIKTGYKVAYKSRDGKYYSIATNIEYKPGLVPKPKYRKSIATRFSDYFKKDLLLPGNPNFKKDFYGYTGCYINIIDCKNRLNSAIDWDNSNFHSTNKCIIKIQFNDTVYDGYYQGDDIICGNNIKSIEEIKI
jgi:hypothetical protein